jgi:glycogen synthase
MRVCIVSQEYPPVTDYWGGIGTQYGRLAPALGRLGHDVHVLTLQPSTGPVEDRIDGVAVRTLAAGRHWPWRVFSLSRAVHRTLRAAGRFDVVLSPEFRGEAFGYSRRQEAGPLVTHLLTSSTQLLAVRPGLTWLERNGPNARLVRAAERRQAENSSALLAPGEAILRWARELWSIGGVPSKVLPLCIDVEQVRRAARGELPEGFPQEGPAVTFASRLDGHKGVQQLVMAMKRVWRSRPEVQLVLVGRDAPWDGRMMSDHLLELAGKDADRLHLLGYQPDDRYFPCVAASDVVAIPSLWESFCLAAVEAMALGRPVVGTRGHGFSEFMRERENGLLVERGSVDELAAALERLLGDAPLRQRLGEAAARTAEGLDAESVAPGYVEALSSASAAPR